MHGSSSVPKEWVERINNAGGKMKSTSGVPEDQYLPGRQAGRVQGEHRHRRPAGLVCRSTARRSATIRPISTCVRPGKVFMAAYADYIVHKNTKLGSAGQLEGVRKTL